MPSTTGPSCSQHVFADVVFSRSGSAMLTQRFTSWRRALRQSRKGRHTDVTLRYSADGGGEGSPAASMSSTSCVSPAALTTSSSLVSSVVDEIPYRRFEELIDSGVRCIAPVGRSAGGEGVRGG